MERPIKVEEAPGGEGYIVQEAGGDRGDQVMRSFRIILDKGVIYVER